MSACMLSTTSRNLSTDGRRPQLSRAAVVPQAHRRRHRFRRSACGPSLMALSPLDAFFDLSPSHLLETEEFIGLERTRGMAVDFIEDSEGFEIKADIPGVAKRDIKLDVDHNVVTISAKRSSQAPSEGPNATDDDTDPQAQDVGEDSSDDKILQNDSTVLRYERYDMFQSRSFRVPKTADLKTVTAKYMDGVLTVDIKKREDVMEDKRTVDIA